MILSCLGCLLLRYRSLPLPNGEHRNKSQHRRRDNRRSSYDAALAKFTTFDGFSLIDARPDVGALFFSELLRPRQQPSFRAMELQAGQQRVGLVRLACALPVAQIDFQLLLASEELARIVQPNPQ